jgi:hypothetical protein
MMRSLTFFRWMSMVLVVAVTATTVPAPARAAMIATTDAAAAADRQRVEAFIERSDVASRLQALGVRPEDAKARVAALDDEEVAALARRVETLPAGGFAGEVIGALLIVFLVLLLTDILGYTKVFPFTRQANTRK